MEKHNSEILETLETIATTRESLIMTQYTLAIADWKFQCFNNPLNTEYYVYSGCINSDMGKELAKRFRQNGIDASYSYSLFGSYIYIKLSYKHNILKNK